VRALHQRLGDAHVEWPHLAPPDDLSEVTVFDTAGSSDEEHGSALERWGRSVWAPWDPHVSTVRQWCDGYAATQQ